MRIETGHVVTADVTLIEGKFVRFVTDDGRTMFEVCCGDDGKSIEVRGVESFKFNEVIYGGFLDVRPRAANCVYVMAQPYNV